MTEVVTQFGRELACYQADRYVGIDGYKRIAAPGQLGRDSGSRWRGR